MLRLSARGKRFYLLSHSIFIKIVFWDSVAFSIAKLYHNVSNVSVILVMANTVKLPVHLLLQKVQRNCSSRDTESFYCTWPLNFVHQLHLPFKMCCRPCIPRPFAVAVSYNIFKCFLFIFHIETLNRSICTKYTKFYFDSKETHLFPVQNIGHELHWHASFYHLLQM